MHSSYLADLKLAAALISPFALRVKRHDASGTTVFIKRLYVRCDHYNRFLIDTNVPLVSRRSYASFQLASL
jgi:hypothetical protein